MKKLFLVVILLTLVSCGEIIEEKDTLFLEDKKCDSVFTIWEVDKTSLKVKGVVVSDDIKIVSSPMAGNIDYLNCEAWEEVSDSTVIAKISPDFNNPNIINLSIQKWSLANQKINLQSVKTSTIASFDIQIASLDKQILSLKEQIILLEKNISLTKKSASLNKNDLEKQIISLQDSISTLQTNLELSKKSKQEALEKIDINREGLLTNIKNISKDNLLKIDEIFWVTTENKDLNDKYDTYISAKNSGLRDEVENEFRRLNLLNIDNLDDEEISIFLWNLIVLNGNTGDSVKESIVNISLTQAQIDSFYYIFLNYSNSLAEVKNNWDGLENSKASIATGYDTQISSLQSQINTSRTSLENMQTNKLDSTDVSLELQLSNLESQSKTLDSNLTSLLSQLANLEMTKQTQVLNLDNQILQINQSINSLSTNLSARSIYANISGRVKQKVSSSWNSVGINSPLCQIIPSKESTKIKIYSPIELNIWDTLIFIFKEDAYEIIIENVLIYKDPATQNYVYESNYLDKDYFKDGEILSLSFNNISLNENEVIKNEIIKIPVGYIKNKMNGNFVKVSSGSTFVEREVVLWDINGSLVEIEEGLERVLKICK